MKNGAIKQRNRVNGIVSGPWPQALSLLVFFFFSLIIPVPVSAGADNSALNPQTALHPIESYEDRVAEYLDYCVHADSLGSAGLFTQIARMELGEGPLDPCVIESKLDFINQRNDTSDFYMAGLIRILYQYADSPLLDEQLLDAIIECVINFKYWIDEPGTDSMVYWSENHQILYHSAEYLAGTLFPGEIFANSGLFGWEHAEKALPMIEKWLERRFYLGFSEWHSNVYYDKDLAPILNLADFAEDNEIAVRASIVADLLLFDILVNSHHGVFGVSHGRSYVEYVTGGRNESTACVIKLVSGKGSFNSRNNMSGISLATGRKYLPPGALQGAGADNPAELVNMERISIDFDDREDYGLNFEDDESGIFWWGMGAYADWRVVDLTFRMAEDLNLWENDFFAPFSLFRPLWEMGTLPYLSVLLSDVTSGSVLSTVNTYAYRTPDYMLASAQDHRWGELGYQEHQWQATMDVDAVIFTSHPGSLEGRTPGYWTGGWKPKVVQEKNVLVAIYEWKPASLFIPGLILPFTHAYIPQDSFDELKESGHWLFGRKDGSYFALYSSGETRWSEGEWQGVDLIADGTPNVWICEMGSEAGGSFKDFVLTIENAAVSVTGTFVMYDSPSLGTITTGLYAAFRVNGQKIDVSDYPRFDNPYCRHEFGSNPISIEFEEESLILDFETPSRITTWFK